MIINPFVFTKEALLDRGVKWIAEWLNLFAVFVFVISLGYFEPSWKFVWITYTMRLKNKNANW